MFWKVLKGITGMTSKQKTTVKHERVEVSDAMKSANYFMIITAPKWSLACCMSLAVFAAAGCSPSDQEINSFVHAWEASVSSPDYRVQPPDSLEISSASAMEIDGSAQMVRQDGKITLCLLGDVKVAGMTPTEISRKLESLLQKYYVDPQVSVRVASQASKKYYVFGEVAQPGPFQYTGRDTLVGVLALAQPTFVAWRDNIKVIHPSHEDNERRVMTINADRIMKEGRMDQNILIEEGDIIYVPPTPLAWVAQRLREVLWPFAPMTDSVRSPYQAYTGVDTDMTRMGSGG